MATVLLKAGADPNLVTDVGVSIIFVISNSLNYNIKDWTPLMEACRMGQIDMVELLVDNDTCGANPNTINGVSYRRPLVMHSYTLHFKGVCVCVCVC